MVEYLKKEALHTAFAIGVTVLVAVAGDLTDIASFKDISLTGLGVTAVRTLATVIVTLGSRHTV